MRKLESNSWEVWSYQMAFSLRFRKDLCPHYTTENAYHSCRYNEHDVIVYMVIKDTQTKRMWSFSKVFVLAHLQRNATSEFSNVGVSRDFNGRKFQGSVNNQRNHSQSYVF